MIFGSCHILFFFFKQKTAYEMRISDWSSDVCSSDLSTALLADFITIIAISVLAGIVVRGGMAGASGSFLLVGAAAAAIWLLPPLFARISSRQLDNRTSLPIVRASAALLFLDRKSKRLHSSH